MNLLQLVNQARVECGVSGPALTTAQSQVGESARMVAWVQQAWIDIQTSKEDLIAILTGDHQVGLVDGE